MFKGIMNYFLTFVPVAILFSMGFSLDRFYTDHNGWHGIVVYFPMWIGTQYFAYRYHKFNGKLL